MFEILILKSVIRGNEEIIHQGRASSVTLPGVDGEFEILDFHKPIISRLKKGHIIVDNNKAISIKGGVAKMERQRLVAFVNR